MLYDNIRSVLLASYAHSFVLAAQKQAGIAPSEILLAARRFVGIPTNAHCTTATVSSRVPKTVLLCTTIASRSVYEGT